MKNLKGRLVSLLLSALLAASAMATFVGCAPGEDDKEATVADATAVDYRTDGVYETTLTLPDSVAASFDGLTARDVEAQYRYFDRDKYESDRNGAISVAAAKGDKNMTTGGVDPQKYYVDGKATVKSVEADGRTMTVSFEDTCTDHRYTESYTIFINSKGIAATVNVNRQNISISVAESDAEKKVYASDKEVTFSVAIDGSKFSGGLSVSDIHLGGSFEGMQAKILSKADENFTLQLKGELKKYEDANVYLDGTVEIDPAGMENASGSVSLSVPVTVAAARLVAEEFRMQGADFTVPVELGDVAALGLNFSSLTKDDFTFEKSVSLEEAEEEENSGIVVSDFQKTGDTRGVLTLSIENAADRNAAAKILSGCTVKIDCEQPVTFAAGISAAGFYPVLDYAEQKGGEIELTLIRHADNGKFGQLSEEMLSFRDDFEGARILSLKQTDDLNATLVIAVPADGQTAETLNKDGTIELASGALVNVWGDVSTEPVSHFRNYSQDSMGRDLSQSDVDVIKNIVGGFGNTAFGTISGVASGAASGVNGIITVLELTGIRKSERVMLEEITQKLTQIQETLSMQTEMLEKLQQNDLQKDVETFDTLLMNLNQRCDRVQKYLETAALDPKKNVGLALPTEPVQGIDEKGNKFNESDEDFQIRKQQYENDMESYGGELVNRIREKEQAKISSYIDFTSTYKELATYFNDVANAVLKTSIIDQYDELCTYLFNFETQTYPSRYAFRFDIYCALARAISLLMVYYGNDLDNGTLSDLAPLFVDATEALKKSGFSEKNGDFIKIQCYSLNKTMYNQLDIEYWGRDAYVCYRTGFADKTDAFDDGTDLDDAGRAKFLQRMQGRTILEELRLARFSNLDDCMEKAQYSYIDGTPYKKDISGVAFFCWDTSKLYWGKTYHYYYAWIMEWNSKDYTSKMCSYNRTGEVWCRYATWFVA